MGSIAGLLLLLSALLLVTNRGKIMVTADLISDILADVASRNKQIQMNVNAEVARAKGMAAAALKKATKGVSPMKSLKYSGSGSSAHYVNSGKDENGDPFYIDQEDVVIGNTLYRTERVYNSTTKQMDENKYTIDLTDPDGKLVPSRRRRRRRRRSRS
ncbi:PREDICTED: uncharacterized protein LOC105361829 [Ceratosolen solmsi marchali]|uniref:Uncharacterized protein LOC105361829 n=1 Tax=Ceratosolen solmsi marchali TaxID=326594 RepID=A0AAJ7DV04_9HYME|nr:PREDICTED: uncharacterized protein LOC105361829 [Ceratosolen solmsi marchali]